MRKLLLSFAVLFLTVALSATTRTRSIKIDVILHDDGSADITEVWDIYSNTGTEWYLVRSNLGDIEIDNFKVFENGEELFNEGDWKVDRTLEQKSGKCGIVDKGRSGYELCWGLGEYGDHIFTASYTMTNLVKSLDDYDAFNHQFISPEMTSAPEYASLTISKDGYSFAYDDTKIWAFGFNGQINIVNGKIFAESSEQFIKKSSMIVMACFNKGIFTPTSVQRRPFEDMKNAAFEGSTYEKAEDDDEEQAAIMVILVLLILGFIGFLAASIVSERKKQEKWFGVKSIKDIDWTRSVPFDGNIIETAFILEKFRQPHTIAPALILKMIDKGLLKIEMFGKKPDIHFAADGDLGKLNKVERELYDMMLEASGTDQILKSREFNKWSKIHYKRVNAWIGMINSEAIEMLEDDRYIQGQDVTPACQDMCRRSIGFKKFLHDNLMNEERSSAEVSLWKDYLVYAALYGIADRVAKELKDINPTIFEQTFTYDYVTFYYIMMSANNFSNSLATASKMATSVSAAGGGGFSSFGGGGGFSGGGAGGGGR